MSNIGFKGYYSKFFIVYHQEKKQLFSRYDFFKIYIIKFNLATQYTAVVKF